MLSVNSFRNQADEREQEGRCMHQSSPPTDQPAATIGGAMTVSEFCRWASIGRTKLYAEIKAGRIKPRKIGAKTVILRSEGEAWLSSLPTL
jgi:hypothetical protein